MEGMEPYWKAQRKKVNYTIQMLNYKSINFFIII